MSCAQAAEEADMEVDDISVASGLTSEADLSMSKTSVLFNLHRQRLADTELVRVRPRKLMSQLLTRRQLQGQMRRVSETCFSAAPSQQQQRSLKSP